MSREGCFAHERPLLPSLVSGKGCFAHERLLLPGLVSRKGCFAHERLLLPGLVSGKGCFAHERLLFKAVSAVTETEGWAGKWKDMNSDLADRLADRAEGGF